MPVTPPTPILLNQAVDGKPGDTFTFTCPTSYTQYRFSVSPTAVGLDLSLWKGAIAHGNGLAENKPGKDYIDYTCPAGPIIVRVDAVPGPFTILVTARSIWDWMTGG